MTDADWDDEAKPNFPAIVEKVKPKRGRPSTFTQEIADRICRQIIEGLSLRAICLQEDMPDLTTVIDWRRARPSFGQQYARAREDQADTFADEMMAIADDKTEDWKQDPITGVWKPDHDTVQRARLRVDTRKWIASKLKPKDYGERVEQRITGADGGPVQHQHIAVSLTAEQLAPEARDALRAALLGIVGAKDEEGDGA